MKCTATATLRTAPFTTTKWNATGQRNKHSTLRQRSTIHQTLWQQSATHWKQWQRSSQLYRKSPLHDSGVQGMHWTLWKLSKAHWTLQKRHCKRSWQLQKSTLHDSGVKHKTLRQLRARSTINTVTRGVTRGSREAQFPGRRITAGGAEKY